MPDTAPKSKRAAAAGVIRPDELYRLDELQARLRMGSWGLRKMRRAGLAVYRVSGRGFVLGADVISFVKKHGEERPFEQASRGQAEE